MNETEIKWERFIKKAIPIEARRLSAGELEAIATDEMKGVGHKAEDLVTGAMLARDPANHSDQWVINPAYFIKHYEEEYQPEMTEADRNAE